MSWLDCAWIDRHGRVRVVVADERALDDVLGELTVTSADAGWDVPPRPLRLRPDVATRRRSPWDPARAVVLCDLVEADGAPSALCPRTTLKRQLARVAELGLSVIAAAELELHLAGPDGAPVSRQIDNYGIVAGAEHEQLLAELRALRDAGVPVTATNPEYGGGQFEVNLHHEEALAAMDAVTLLRAWVAVIARRHGLGATFAAKPWPDGSGSGLHLHQSLWRGSANAFWDDGELSPLGRRYLAGLLARMAELTPLGSPTPSAYRRRSDGSFCPTAVAWGGDNRTVAVRVLVEGEGATRIEQRDAAANANVHLTLAGQLAAGLDGIARELEPPPPVDGDAYARGDLPPLPRTLHDALDPFAASELAVELLSAEAHGALVRALRPAAEADLAGAAPAEAWR